MWGLNLTTLRSGATCSTDWASQKPLLFQFWMVTLLGKYSWKFFLPSVLWIHYASPFWYAKILLRNVLIVLWGGGPLYIRSFCFCFFEILSIFKSWHFNCMYCVVGLFRFIFFETLGFPDLGICFLPHVREVFSYFLK